MIVTVTQSVYPSNSIEIFNRLGILKNIDIILYKCFLIALKYLHDMISGAKYSLHVFRSTNNFTIYQFNSRHSTVGVVAINLWTSDKIMPSYYSI